MISELFIQIPFLHDLYELEYSHLSHILHAGRIEIIYSNVSCNKAMKSVPIVWEVAFSTFVKGVQVNDIRYR